MNFMVKDSKVFKECGKKKRDDHLGWWSSNLAAFTDVLLGDEDAHSL